MPQAPLYAYLGFGEGGKFQLFVAPTPLNPWGARVIKGRSPPASIEAQLVDLDDPGLAIKALRAATAYLQGEEFGLDTPVFGDDPVTPKRRRKKKVPSPDVKVV